MVDIQPNSTQSISDDQELAKALAGMNQQVDDSLQFEETPVPGMPTPSVMPPTDNVGENTDANLPPVADETPVVEPVNISPLGSMPAVDADLAPIKDQAINELRPLVDKLNLQPEEKFDTYLLLLRSTDDRTLIAPAYVAAQAIADEARKAQALLDIIKEIDYLSGPKQA